MIWNPNGMTKDLEATGHTPGVETEHDRIVDQLRRAGWERWEAIEEADRLMAERTEKRRNQ